MDSPRAKPPWRKRKPGGASTKLTPEFRAKAKSRAAKAGRPYPNLVDNMWAAQQQNRAQMPPTNLP